MIENRKYQRVNYLGTGWLHLNEAKYHCRLENISNNGALVRIKKTPGEPVNPGDKCYLKLHLEDERHDYHQVEARIVRFESDLAALEFNDLEIEANNLLDNLIQKEVHFINGGQMLIDLGLKAAFHKGIGLTAVHFDNGALNPEREIHTLRLSAGEHSINVHLHREEIEAFHADNGSEQTRTKIHHAVARLNV